MKVGEEINYKGIELIYSGFQMENKLCFYIKNTKEQIMYLSLSQLKKLNLKKECKYCHQQEIHKLSCPTLKMQINL